MSSSEASTSCIFPFDIIECIIDLLGEDNDATSLKAMSLICQSVLPRCRKYLFSSIDINNPRSTERFRDILLSPQTDIPRHIRRLNYRLHVDTLFDVRPALLERMSCLQHLYLWYSGNSDAFNWIQMGPSARLALLNLMRLPTLTYLRLFNIHHFLISDLSSCTSLTHLQFGSIEVKDESPFPPLDTVTVPMIQKFTIWESATTAMKLLTAKLVDGRVALDFKNLKILSVRFDGDADVEAVRSLLKEVKVEELRVDVYMPFVHPTLVISLVDMAFHTFGTTLYLVWSCFDLDASDCAFVTLCNELSAMATANNILKTLRIKLRVLSGVVGMILPDSEWDKLDAVLSGPGWSRLEYISIDIMMCDPVAKLEDLGSLTSLPTMRLPRLSSLNLGFKFSVRLL